MRRVSHPRNGQTQELEVELAKRTRRNKWSRETAYYIQSTRNVMMAMFRIANLMRRVRPWRAEIAGQDTHLPERIPCIPSLRSILTSFEPVLPARIRPRKAVGWKLVLFPHHGPVLLPNAFLARRHALPPRRDRQYVGW